MKNAEFRIFGDRDEKRLGERVTEFLRSNENFRVIDMDTRFIHGLPAGDAYVTTVLVEESLESPVNFLKEAMDAMDASFGSQKNFHDRLERLERLVSGEEEQIPFGAPEKKDETAGEQSTVPESAPVKS